MEARYTEIISRIKESLHSSPHQRVLVAVAGPPGSGKTTIATHIVNSLNGDNTQPVVDGDRLASISAISVSVDGFHYTRRHLDSLPNREEAHLRRGAPWTFDIDAIIRLVEDLKASATVPVNGRSVINAPSFDHALKDPVADDIHIDVETEIIILEGNYLLLDITKWKEISELVDVTVFVDVDVECARARVAKRHVVAGIEDTFEKGLARFDANDALNGDLIRKNLVPFDVRIESIDARA